MIARMTLCLGLAAATAAPASAQSFEEAVRINAAVALELCLSGGRDMAAWAARFRAAGFSERVERSTSNSDTTHIFTAPADTVGVVLYYGEMPEYCSVESDHLAVTAASPVLDEVVPRLYPGYVRLVDEGPVDPATGAPAQCVRYEDPTNPIGHVVGVTAGGDAGACIDNGTALFYSSYRV